ncbi:MAG: hypothetical protein ACFFCV_11740 [Promethearchaeota archaeon]
MMLNEIEYNNLKKYVSFCKYFQKHNSPILRFKHIPEEYKNQYIIKYHINEEDVCKATFFFFIITFISTLLLFIFFINVGVLFFNIFYSLILALIFAGVIAFNFNITIYKQIKKDEKVIDTLLSLIKINFSLMKTVKDQKSDLCLSFVKLIKDYKLPISELFKHIFGKIHLGYAPEEELLMIKTSSKDFNSYVSELMIKNFGYDSDIDLYDENSAEKKFRVLLKSIQSKIGIIFFTGFFFPLVLSSFILFQQVKILFALFIAPFLLFLMYWMFKKMVRINIGLIGVLDEYSGLKEKKFSEFLLFLEVLALILENNYSPETAFIKAYSKSKAQLRLLNELFYEQISYLISFQYTFEDLIKHLKLALESPRYKILLDLIYDMLKKSAYYSSRKIKDILNIIERHRRLEEKFKLIISGKKFLVKVFVFMFPGILGAIGGILPLVMAIVKNMNFSENIQEVTSFYELVDIFDVLMIFSILLICNLITCYYFLKIVRHKRIYLVMTISIFIFILAFSQSIMFSATFS